jgi:hypothetical protein
MIAGDDTSTNTCHNAGPTSGLDADTNADTDTAANALANVDDGSTIHDTSSVPLGSSIACPIEAWQNTGQKSYPWRVEVRWKRGSA